MSLHLPANFSPAEPSGPIRPLLPEVRSVALEAADTFIQKDRAAGRPDLAIAVVASDGIRADVIRPGPAGGTGQQVLLWSLSKTVLAAATFRLIDRGLVALATPVSAILPDAPVVAGTTVGQLLSHTAGITDYGGWPDYHRAVRETPGRPWPLDVYLDRARRIGPRDAPGRRWHYSNIGYLVVRRIVERLTARSLVDALDDLVFRPLGLVGTSVSTSPGDRGPLLFAAASNGTYHPGWVSHGVISSTIDETARLFDRLLRPGFLSASSLLEMTTPVIRVANETHLGPLDWAHGVLVAGGTGTGRLVGHTGGGPGSTTAALRFEGGDGRIATVAVAIADEREHGASHIALAVGRAVLTSSGADLSTRGVHRPSHLS